MNRSYRNPVRFILTACFLILSSAASANNLSISNVSFEKRDPTAKTVVVEFDISWENSWKSKINHDAVWLTVRLYDPTHSPTDKILCEISASGLNPTGLSAGSNANLELYVPSDKKGAFLRPSSYGTNATVSSANTQLTIDYESCGFSGSDSVYVAVNGIEMVYVPQGAFYAGDFDTSTASLHEGSADSDPWYVSSSDFISVTNAATNGYRYVSAGNGGEDSTGSSFTIPSAFPKGFSSFYAMKYEITEGQWVEFLNALPSAAARVNRDVTNAGHKNTDTVLKRNTISCSGTPLTCSTSRPHRAMNYLSWMDLAAFLDWAALRPMSELEFEKASRGPLFPIAGEYAWGDTTITAAAELSSGAENGSETVSTSGANAHFNATTLTGGDASNGPDYAQGPLRSAIFSGSLSTRESAGATYYGLMEMSGNVREMTVTIGNASGRIFTGTHGDGILTTASGYEGNATNSDWPGIDAVSSRGVTEAAGTGTRGGGWNDASSGAALRISDRSSAASANSAASSNAGGRGVRTYDGS